MSASAALTVQQIVSEARFDAVADLQFRLIVPEGRRATVQVSADLISWSDSTSIPVTGVTNVQDPLAAANDLQFYRVIVE